MKRQAHIARKTKETDIALTINLDGTGNHRIATTIPFLDHMLDLFAVHSGFDISLQASGDTHVDDHHTVEDVAICLGDAIAQALDDKKGIVRYSFFSLPMDEVLMDIAIDLGGRPYFVYEVSYTDRYIKDFNLQLVEEFLRAFSTRLAMNLHVNMRYGKNEHHIFEAVFKGLARAMRQATSLDPRCQGIPSSKGHMDA